MTPINGQNNNSKEEINYPVDFDMKAIMDNMIDKEENVKYIKSSLLKVGVQYGKHHFKYSSNKKYISITIRVKIESKIQMEKLYQELKSVPGLKYAV